MNNLQIFEKLSSLYVIRYLNPHVRKFPKYNEDKWDSICFFISGYAYEHQGRAPDYAPAASDTIREISKNHNLDSPEIAKKVWEEFKIKLDKVKPNSALNPLCPQHTLYTMKYKIDNIGQKKDENDNLRQFNTKKKSIIELMSENKDCSIIMKWCAEKIRQNKLREIHEKLCTINGVSTKIASFFLRDIAYLYDIRSESANEFLQPVDGWIRFVINKISNNRYKKDMDISLFIVENSKNHILVNMGIWYFCTQIAYSSQYLVEKALYEKNIMTKMIKNHLSDIKIESEEYSNLKNKFFAE